MGFRFDGRGRPDGGANPSFAALMADGRVQSFLVVPLVHSAASEVFLSFCLDAAPISAEYLGVEAHLWVEPVPVVVWCVVVV